MARVCNLAALPPAQLRSVLTTTDVGDVWGLGKKTAEKLRALSIVTVQDLINMDPVVAACGSL